MIGSNAFGQDRLMPGRLDEYNSSARRGVIGPAPLAGHAREVVQNDDHQEGMLVAARTGAAVRIDARAGP